jgi:asparagine synthase (glutamine-hydrolysing)
MEDTVAKGAASRNLPVDPEQIARTEAKLEEAVKSRMIADVPLGVFLSGGIDSTTVTALMQKNSTVPVKTFSIGFREREYNEAEYANAIARHLGTEHTEFYVSPQDALDVVPVLAEVYDEPFADSSQIPTYLVSALTRRHVTVALSGDGGDEVFAGYNRYYVAQSLLKKFTLLTPAGRRLLAAMIRSRPPQTWTALLRRLLPGMKTPQAGDKLYKLADILKLDRRDVYRSLISIWQYPEDLVIDSKEHAPAGDGIFPPGCSSQLEQMQYLDTVSYLPDDILTKLDRASMAVSLEARVPLLDHRLVEHAWSLPRSLLIRHNKPKWILRQILYNYVPRPLVERSKMGFGIPLDSWLRGPLREWAASLLEHGKIRSQAYLDAELIRQKWDEHQAGRRNWQYQLWNVIMFQAWHDRWIN